MQTVRPRTPWKWVSSLGLILALGVSAAGAQEVSRTLERDLHLMEGLISDVLIDSPCWLVSGGGPVYGFYIDGVGAVFSFETSLVTRNHNSFLRIRRGNIFLWGNGDGDWDDEDYDDEGDDALDRYNKKRAQRAERCYKQGVVELREALADAGSVLEELPEQDWVIITAALEDNSYFRKEKISRLVLKARVSDLRAREAGRISAEEMEQRIVESVY